MTPQPPRSARRHLGAYLAAAFSALTLCMTLLMVVVIGDVARREVQSSIGSNVAELANQTASRLDRSMFERYREVQLMARRLQGESDLARVRLLLEELQSTYPYYAWIGRTDLQGQVLAATRGMLVGANVAKRPWFVNALEGRYMGDVHEAVLLSRLLAPEGREPLRFVDITFPVNGADGRPTGLLGAHLSWRWAEDIRSAIFVPVGRQQQVEPLILAADGAVLLGPRGLVGQKLALPSVTAVGRQQAGFLMEEWPDGKEYLVGFSRTRGFMGYPGLGWTVLVRQDLAEANAPVRELQWRIGLAGLLMAALFSLLGWLAARAVTRPLLALADAAGKLERGESAEVHPSSAYKEVETLGTALNSLVGNLRQQERELRELNADLERRVEVRTGELREAMEQARANEQRVQTIIESAQDPFIGMDLQGRVTDWNTQAEVVFGWTREEIVGRRVADTLLAERHVPAFEAALASYLASGESSLLARPIERILRRRDGREITVELRVGRVTAGRQRFLTAFLHDISQRKAVERLKDEFVSTVSHELRTPLTAIHGSLSLIASGAAGEPPPGVRKLVEIASQSSQRLVRLVNDILDVEKIAAGRMSYQMRVQPLGPLLEQALRDTQAYAQAHGVALNVLLMDAVTVECDADRIVQVCVNLLSNAARFSPKEGAVEIRLVAHEGRARVSVVDHGPGVPPEFRERIFSRFAQAQDGLRSGTGLGLNICRSIVEAHGGTIGFTSEPGVRTEFYFELPAAD